MRQFMNLLKENYDPMLDVITGIVGSVSDPIEGVWLFGSRAKGTHRPDSDYDVLVIANIDEDEIDYLQDELHGLVGDHHIEFLVTTPTLSDDPSTIAYKAKTYGQRLL